MRIKSIEVVSTIFETNTSKSANFQTIFYNANQLKIYTHTLNTTYVLLFESHEFVCKTKT